MIVCFIDEQNALSMRDLEHQVPVYFNNDTVILLNTKSLHWKKFISRASLLEILITKNSDLFFEKIVKFVKELTTRNASTI